MTRRIDRHRHRPGWRQALGALLACALIVAPAWSATASRSSDFGNDALGRLVKEIIEPGCSDLGNYSYNVGTTSCVRPHAVTQVAVTAGGTRQYTYDGNGNLTQENLYSANGAPLGGRSLSYTSFNMPAKITAASAVADFFYGPEHQRVKQVSTRSGTTLYLNPDSNGGLLYEKDIKPDNSVEHRQFITAEGQVVAVIKQIGATSTVAYLHRDHLGSTTAVTNPAGTVVESLAYEPFGKRRVADGQDDPAGLGDPASNIVALTTERGFTNHEHLDELGLIHMNGRIYDPLLGRFTSADPTTPNPLDLQSYNRYSYTRNNPLRMLDPSGFAETATTPAAGSLASKLEHTVAAAKTILTNWANAAFDVARGGDKAVQSESQANIKSAFYDAAKGGWNAGLGVVEGVPNLITGGALPGGSDYNAFLSTYRANYDTPVFGATVEVLATVGVLRVLGEIGAAGRAAKLEGPAANLEANAAKGVHPTFKPGPYAGESIPARGPGRDFNVAERAEGKRIFNETGCHTCGTKNAGTKYNDPVLDHQPVSALNKEGAPQRLYTQCLYCSRDQGLAVIRALREGAK